MTNRYFLPDFSHDVCELRGDELHHLSRVMRLGPGDAVVVFDGRGNEVDARIVELARDRATLQITGPGRREPIPAHDLVLATAVPKGDRFRWLVEKATELGVTRLIPLQTARSVVEPGGSKLERMRGAVIEACKQSRRNRLMAIDPPTLWDAFVRTVVPDGLTFIGDASGVPAAELSPSRPDGRPVVLVVGPEGGLTDSEQAQGIEAGAVRVSLGPRTLRVETAALALAVVFGLGSSANNGLCAGAGTDAEDSP